MKNNNSLNTLNTEVTKNVQPSLFDYLPTEDLIIKPVPSSYKIADEYIVNDDDDWDEDGTEPLDPKFLHLLNS